MKSANTDFEITSQRRSIEMFGDVFEAFVCSHVGHLFMSHWNDFTPDVGRFIGLLIGNICTVLTVILPSFKKKSFNEDPTRMVGFLADNIKERIRGCGFSKAVIALASQVLGKLGRREYLGLWRVGQGKGHGKRQGHQGPVSLLHEWHVLRLVHYPG